MVLNLSMSLAAQEYRGILLWGRMLHSNSYYVASEMERALAENAPIDAIYQELDGHWVCVSDLTPGHPFRAAYEKDRLERL